jgi:hypothetical protein
LKIKLKKEMKKEEKKTPWMYRVHVSKDSPKNVNRGFFDGLPDNEYSRGYYHPIDYTELKEAQHALAYFEKGFIEKSRNVVTLYEYGHGRSERRETIKL